MKLERLQSILALLGQIYSGGKPIPIKVETGGAEEIFFEGSPRPEELDPAMLARFEDLGLIWDESFVCWKVFTS